LCAGGAGIHAVCRKCSSSSSLSYSAGPVSSSFSAESSALIHDLEWYHFHLKSCHFQSAFFLTDSQSALTLFSSTPAFLQPKSFWDVWNFFNSLSSRVALSFQWVPGHAGLPGNERADSLAKTGVTLPVTYVPCPLAPTIAKIRHTCYFLSRRNLSHNSLSCQIPLVSLEKLTLLRLIHCKLSRLRCHGHSLLFSSYLCRFGLDGLGTHLFVKAPRPGDSEGTSSLQVFSVIKSSYLLLISVVSIDGGRVIVVLKKKKKKKKNPTHWEI